MKSLLFALAATATLVASVELAGCTELTTRVGPQVAKAINRYCQEPADARATLRGQVNAAIAPNQVRVTCAGDPVN